MSDLEPIQRSRLGEIGQLLAKAREEKGLTLEEVSGKTLIRAAILKAIEEGDARPLPEPVYIRGFIRRFGDLVGLNGMELCDTFPWQPSGSVPLSFVSAGNIVAASSTAQKTAEPAAVETPELKAEPSAVESPEELELRSTPAGDLAAVAASKLDAPKDSAVSESENGAAALDIDDIPTPEAAEIEAPIPVVAEAPIELGGMTPPEAVSFGQAPADEPEAVVDSATPDHEAAYESRAALFEDDVEDSSDVAAAGTAIVATSAALASPAVTEQAETAMGADESVAASATASGSGVATLPPPPAPVMYREPEQRKLVPWILALVAGAVGLGIAMLAFGGNRQNVPNVTNEPAAVEQLETAENGTATDSSAGSVAADSADSTSAVVPADKVVLELEVKGTEEAWMDIFVDGELQIEGNQAPGFKQRWEGSKEIELATARPDMVWISVNGSQPQPFGKFEEATPVKIGGFKPANAQ